MKTTILQYCVHVHEPAVGEIPAAKRELKTRFPRFEPALRAAWAEIAKDQQAARRPIEKIQFSAIHNDRTVVRAASHAGLALVADDSEIPMRNEFPALPQLGEKLQYIVLRVRNLEEIAAPFDLTGEVADWLRLYANNGAELQVGGLALPAHRVDFIAGHALRHETLRGEIRRNLLGQFRFCGEVPGVSETQLK